MSHPLFDTNIKNFPVIYCNEVHEDHVVENLSQSLSNVRFKLMNRISCNEFLTPL